MTKFGDILEVKLMDGKHTPYYKKKVDVNNEHEKQVLADDLYTIRNIELIPQHKRKKQEVDLLGANWGWK